MDHFLIIILIHDYGSISYFYIVILILFNIDKRIIINTQVKIRLYLLSALNILIIVPKNSSNQIIFNEYS